MLTEKSPFSQETLIKTLLQQKKPSIKQGKCMSKGVALLLFLVLATSSTVSVLQVKGEARTIVVPDDYPTIKEAINAAKESDTIFVKKGTNEGPANQTLVIGKSISIIGESTEKTIIKLQPAYNVTWILGTPIYQYSNSMVIDANNVHLINLTIRYTGMIIANGDRLQIIGSNISSFAMNSLFIKGSNCNLTNNYFSYSINVEGSSNAIKQNSFDELTLQSTTQNTIEANTFHYLKLFSSHSNMISKNNISVSYSSFAVEVHNSNRNNFDSNYITGLELSNSNDNVFVKNNITSSIVSFMDEYDIDISELDPTGPSNYAIATENSSSNNLFYFNSIANVIINDQHSQDNLFYANAFVGPALNDGIVRISQLKINNNYWDNGSIGNYWSDYLTKYPNASEIGNSGIGNTPYVVSPSHSEFDPIAYIDHYPLVQPFSEDVSGEPEPFPVVPVAAVSVAVVAVVGAGLLVYFKKRKH
jgi:hypothetical protein